MDLTDLFNIARRDWNSDRATLALNPSSLVETTIQINPDLICPKPFDVVGHRIVTQAEVYNGFSCSVQHLISLKARDLLDSLQGYFVCAPPVYSWRVEPEIEVERVFENECWMISIRARGCFDVPVRAGDIHCEVEELP